MEVNPAVVIGIGPQAEEIILRAQELILLRTGLASLPKIFQFPILADEEADAEEQIAAAYYAVSNKTAARNTELSSNLLVDSSRVESFVVAPLLYKDKVMHVARTLTGCARRGMGGGRNAVFLLSKSLRPEDSPALQTVVDTLDEEIQHKKLFNRCFFVDQMDESWAVHRRRGNQ